MTLEADRAVRQPLLESERQATVSHIYKLSTQQLQRLFVSENGKVRPLEERWVELKHHGSAKDVLKKLASEATTGIVGDEKDLRRRKAVFGVNSKPIPQAPTLFASIKQTCHDRLWWAVGGSATVAAVCGGCAHGAAGLVPGVAIIVAVLLIITITSFADWFKDRRFTHLQSLIQEESVAVIRGKFGATQSVSVWDLVVGDVVLLDTGARLPADCLVIESADLQAEEVDSAENVGDDRTPRKVNKSAAGADGADPFLLADSLLTRGQCKAVVCCVGKASSRGDAERKLETDADTRLQVKLKNLANQFTLYGLYAAIIVFLALTITLIIQLVSRGSKPSADDQNQAGIAGTLFAKLSSEVNLVVVLIVVAVPEGLPLTVGVSLAFSVMKMHGDKILVRKLDAPEKMGAVGEICCGKTGTITRNDMKVAQFHCESRPVKNTRKNTLLNCELGAETLERIKASILYNCEARVEMDATTYVPVGNGTEVALLRFLQDAEVPVHLLIQRKLGRIRATSPFSPERKRSAVALECPDRPGRVAVYVKGAPEVVLSLSSHTLASSGATVLGADERAAVAERVSAMASQPLRVLAFAYTEMDLDTWTSQYERQGASPESALEDALANNALGLTFIGAFGLRDPLRAKVQSCIKYAREHGRLGVRLVSGDHVETAKAVALKAGILRPEEAGRMYAVMQAEEFRAAVGELVRTQQEDGPDGKPGEVVAEVENPEAFREVAEGLRVLARATAADKHLLVAGLKSLGSVVTATGDGINDVEALGRADVGLAMGSGCSAAKEAASLVLTDDDFEASLRAVMWGRNIYHNVSRFLQFQVTVNISVLLTVFLGVCVFAQSPISAVQLLWINLIMDTFAALALATEPPLPSVIKGAPFSEGAAILSPAVWRQILGISAWNFLVMAMLIFFGRMIAGLPEYSNDTPTVLPTSPPPGWDAAHPDRPIPCTASAAECAKQQAETVAYLATLAKQRHFTYIFNTFVLLQLFNEINCRKVGRRDFNVFEAFFHNAYFLLVLAGTFAAQVAICECFCALAGTVPLTRSEWGACIAVGATPLLVGFFLKLTPEAWVARVPTGALVDEDRAVTNKVLATWQGTGTDKKGAKGGDDAGAPPAGAEDDRFQPAK